MLNRNAMNVVYKQHLLQIQLSIKFKIINKFFNI